MKKLADTPNAEKILNDNRLKKTAAGLRVLTILASGKNTAVTLSRLVKKTKGLSKATLYGILRRLEMKNIIYKVFDLEGTPHYALYPADLSGHDPEVFLHFYCSRCKKVYRLPAPDFIPAPLPGEFKTTRYMFLMNGVCRSCNTI
jgi:Fur family ferric uptake transcriptional regulator